jgi:hypothetical protein
MDCHPVVVAAKDAEAVEDGRYMRYARCSEAWRVLLQRPLVLTCEV